MATRLAEDPETADAELQAHRDEASRLVARHGGQPIPSPDGSLLASFPGAADALHCALALQETPGGLRWQIGLDEGRVEMAEETPAGEALAVAERLVDLAAPGEVCVSGAVAPHARERGDVRLDPVRMDHAAPLPGAATAYRLTRG